MAVARQGVKRKRRPKNVCPNPMFVKWLEEWRDEALENNWKASYTYSKALTSMKRYPLPINSGEEAKLLEYVGDKVAKMLDKKISEFLDNGGTMEDLHRQTDNDCLPKRPALSSTSTNITTTIDKSPCTRKSPTKQTCAIMSPVQTQSQSGSIGTSLQFPNDENIQKTTPKKQHRSTKEYVPTYRSGPYAVLVALFTAEQASPDFKGYMLKHELITAAQPFCDASFTVPDPPNSYYTAWSSVSKLLKKGLITKSDHPPRFSLTNEGISLAMRLLQVQSTKEVLTSRSPCSPEQLETTTTFDSHIINRSHDNHVTITRETSGSIPSTLYVLNYSPTQSLDTISIVGSHRHTEATAGQCLTETIKQSSTSSSNVVSITLSDSDDDDDIEILPLAQRIGLKPICQNSQTLSTATNVIEIDEDTCGSKTTHNKRRKRDCPLKISSISTSRMSSVPPSLPPPVTHCSSSSTSSNFIETIKHSTSSHSQLSSSSVCTMTSTSNKSLGQSTISQPSTKSSSSINNQSEVPTEVPLDLSSPLFSLRPGQYELILCIDNTESTANRKSKSNFRGLLLEELNKNGVKFSVRKLNVGDFLWIAREIVDIRQGQLRLPESREIVLEYIVERKRMDDLADSIIDRRFHEQKFRMKQSGIYHPIYLVEEYGDITHCRLPERSLHQAITNTQLLDDFYVKQTKDIRESIAYLTIMTRHLQQHYSFRTIRAYPVETLLSLNKQRQQKSFVEDTSIVFGVPFNKFNEASVKTKISTASEMFARHLILIPQSSADKAHAIIEQYPTISQQVLLTFCTLLCSLFHNSLYEAYSRCTTEKEREEMLSSVRAGAYKRKLGLTFSRIIYSLYWKGE